MENQTPGGNISATSDHTARGWGDWTACGLFRFYLSSRSTWAGESNRAKALITYGTWPFDAPWGVHVFFVISGFLITWLLVSERDRRGKIDLKRFYERRFFRILPPAFAYLLVVLILGMVGIVAVFVEGCRQGSFFHP